MTNEQELLSWLSDHCPSECVQAVRDMIERQAEEIEHLLSERAEDARIIGMSSEREAKHLAEIERMENLLAIDVHSCHPNCTKSPCVNRRLREQLHVAKEALERIESYTTDPWSGIASEALTKIGGE